ncbi:MAG: hypothetical protein UFP03_02875 [Paludibacteraceae bacterium]|nr:hypothetical protein [Paludibacteraceae bacterium]
MKKILYLISFLFAMALVGCEEKDPTTPPAPTTPSKIETGAAENIAATSATLKGMVNVDIIDYEEIVFGVMYSTKAEDLVDFTAPSKNGLVLIGNEFKVEVTDLKAETKYYYRAYVMLNTLQILLGDVKEFTTLEKSGSDDEGGSEGEDEGGSEEEGEGGTEDDGDGKVNGYAYVDLGLSVKWAIMNVGATSPEDYGDYFAWGETEPKEEYSWETYKWCDGEYDNLTKYCSRSDLGIVDNKTKLEPEDDAATVNWGDAWRMPTKEEQVELITECNWTLDTVNGVDGYTVTGPNGNSIFLPIPGYFSNTNIEDIGINGTYWSSEQKSDYSSYANVIDMYNDGDISLFPNSRYYGLSIRPVLP